MVFLELLALLLPAISIGIKWITSFCEGTPMNTFLELLTVSMNCFYYQECEDPAKNCIIRNFKETINK